MHLATNTFMPVRSNEVSTSPASRNWLTRASTCAATALFLAPLLSAQSMTELAEKSPVQIRFAGVVGKRPFACGEQYTVGSGKTVTVTPADLRFYVTNVELLDATGKGTPIALDQDGVWQYKNVALVDLEDGTGGCRNGNSGMHAVLTGSVPAGSYSGIRFTVGLPFELSHVDPANSPAPLDFTAMTWVWQAGYKFIRAELLVENEAAAQPAGVVPHLPSGAKSTPPPGLPSSRPRSSGVPIHIGSTGCVSASRTTPPDTECAHPNRATVVLANFDPASDTVIFDFDRLLSGITLSRNAADTAPGCMSGPDDPDCAPIFRALGLPFGKAEAVEQTVFRKQTQ